ncbi:hypothetical protein D9C73_010721 [Collichthys lucidus]|uniref:Uncharacterized protein n=1 Tax=Collichthys lucidus TaxID=240159 RepID=A0A4V6APG6_COLLU|nr:hypothetical protein D9C73_010721 [Collichthys lucidus]
MPSRYSKETANLNPESESLTEPESVTLDQSSEEEKAPETDNGNSQPVETQVDSLAEENPVMNFFKTLVAQVSEPPAAPKGMSIPPPPPPEPPKMEVKGEPAAKPVKPTPKEEPKAAAKEPEASKGKSAKDTLSKFFRSKVDPSKASTLEATPKPEPPPPVQEEKKAGSKSSFLSLFKPKRVESNSVSRGRNTFKAADPKKATPAPAAAGEAAQAAKAKEEPKAAAAKSSEAVVDKPASAASQAGDDAANVPKKLEKRNSIQLFFKILVRRASPTSPPDPQAPNPPTPNLPHSDL